MLFGLRSILDCKWEAQGEGREGEGRRAASLRLGPFKHPGIRDRAESTGPVGSPWASDTDIQFLLHSGRGQGLRLGWPRSRQRPRGGPKPQRAASAVGGAAGPGGAAAVTRRAWRRRRLPRFEGSGPCGRWAAAASQRPLCREPFRPRAAAVGTPGSGGHRGQVSVGEGASAGVAHLQPVSPSRPISHHVRRGVGHHFL